MNGLKEREEEGGDDTRSNKGQRVSKPSLRRVSDRRVPRKKGEQETAIKQSPRIRSY